LLPLFLLRHSRLDRESSKQQARQRLWRQPICLAAGMLPHSFIFWIPDQAGNDEGG
jgi:hypothetical protein